MAISRLKTRSVGGTITAADDDADFDNIIDELNTHTAAASPHTGHVIDTGDTITGELALNISSGNTTALDIDTTATTNNAVELNADSLTTGAGITISADALTTGSALTIASDSSDTSARDIVNITQDNASATLAVCLNLDQDADAECLTIDSEATTANIIDIEAPVLTTGYVFDCADANAFTTGGFLNLVSDSSDTGTRALVQITNDNTAAVNATPVQVQQDAAVRAVFIDQNADGDGIVIDSEATSANALVISPTTHTTGHVVNISDADSLTSGSIMNLRSNSSSATARNLVDIRNSNTSATSATVLRLQQDASAACFEIDMNGNASAFNIDHDTNTASREFAMSITSDNAGAGTPGGIDLSNFSAGEAVFKLVADANDPTSGGVAATGRVAVDIGGSIVYLAYY